MSEPEERGSPEWCTWAHKRIALLEAAIREGLDNYICDGYLDTEKLYDVLQEDKPHE